MMNEDRIREIANLASDHAESTADPFWDLEDGLDYAARLMKARDLKFAELIVRECAGIVQPYMSRWEEDCDLVIKIKEHFGIDR
jgi:hypothetical protein